MTTTSHANCSHEKTKAARAACRAGKLPEGQSQPAAERLAAKAAAASAKAKPRTGSSWGDDTKSYERKGNICGPCGNGHHERCPSGGKQWFCTCEQAAHTL